MPYMSEAYRVDWCLRQDEKKNSNIGTSLGTHLSLLPGGCIGDQVPHSPAVRATADFGASLSAIVDSASQ